MQAQHFPAPRLHLDYYDDLPHSDNISELTVNPYISAPEAAQALTSGFSRGSSLSYPNQDFHYSFNRGELTSRLCTTSVVDHNQHATGLGFAGNRSSSRPYCGPEDSPAYQPPSWDWPGASDIGIVAPAPIYAGGATPTYFGAKSTILHPLPPSVRSQTTRPTSPAAMAILLNPHNISGEEPTQGGYDIPTESASLDVDYVSGTRQIARLGEPSVAEQALGAPEPPPREKKHGCTMCHKRFDRPSTLRKHLLVHTGEKAFVCDTCGRRFGVASNLNRHVKRCVLKLVNASSPTNKSLSDSHTSAVDSPETSHSSSTMSSSTLSSNETATTAVPSALGKRTRTKSQTTGSTPSSSTGAKGPPSTRSRAPTAKRRRRAPSPSQWIPDTLQSFDLVPQEIYRATTVPLPPVRRNPPREERDSWEENTALSPYHPDAWHGVLPGPGFASGFGLGGRDLTNLNLGGRGGFMLGRVMVF
ncbi:hypothetical protein CPB83DRAFT_856755 [Crepidotus variabilis]|uniref:C2H2-type domain-containing protein n=1 Tax=Crepidotus variabilis TaxID=179855 RepID=A0A9P6JNS5_9AGAR|nr:hypothetical protein CPB83DRAFT_856755 [Crepidotus variabilis]